MVKKIRVPVSERAIVQRLNRKLAERDERLCKSKERAKNDLGDFHIIDVRRNAVTFLNVPLEKTAREEGCLADWEELVQS